MGNAYRITEVVGCSPESYADATKIAVERASATLRDMAWFEVKEQRGMIRGGKVAEFQVKLQIGSSLETQA